MSLMYLLKSSVGSVESTKINNSPDVLRHICPLIEMLRDSSFLLEVYDPIECIEIVANPVVETLLFGMIVFFLKRQKLMKIIQNLSLILVAVTLTACANTPEKLPSQQPDMMTECMRDEATKLVGQTGLSEAAIKAKTNAEIVRMVAPGQPVTLDYRSERVTVVTDPRTKIIVQASCG